MCSRPRDEAGRFLPATNIIPTPTSNPVRIARPVDDNFDARLSASITRTLTPMFDQLMNRLDAMETRIAARYNSTSPARDLSSQPRHLESAYIDRRQHVDAKIQRDPIQHVAPKPEPTSTSAEPSPRRTESSETAAEDVCDISLGHPGTKVSVSGEITTAAATTPIPKGDITTLKIDDDIDSIESSRKYDGIDGIEPSNDRVDTADVFRNALQILGRTSGTLFKVKHTFPCPIAHSDVDWGGLSPGSFGDKLASPGQLNFFFFFHFDVLTMEELEGSIWVFTVEHLKARAVRAVRGGVLEVPPIWVSVLLVTCIYSSPVAYLASMDRAFPILT